MLEQIKQVGMTYVTQRYLWFGLALLGLIIAPNLLVLMVSPRAGPVPLFIFGMPACLAAPFLVGQAKLQLGHPRARMLPHFRRAHLLVLSIILVTFFALYPLVLAWLSRGYTLGFVATMLAIGAPMIWGAQLNRFGPMLVAWVAFYSLIVPAGAKWWLDPTNAVLHSIILVVGSGLIILWVWRIATLTEEMDDYLNVYQAMLARRTGSEAIEQRRVVAAQIRRNKSMEWIGDWWHARLGGFWGTSKWRLIRLLRYGYTPTPIEMQGVFMLAMFLAMGIFFSKFNLSNNGGAFAGLWFFAMFGILMPGNMAGELLAQRRPRLATEMLLPLSRSQLIDGLLAATARNALVLWLMMNVGIGFIMLLAGTPVLLADALKFLLVSASLMVATMGISLRVSIWPSLAKRMFVIWIGTCALAGPALGLWAIRKEWGDAPLLLLSGIALAVGALMTRNARRTWMNTELG